MTTTESRRPGPFARKLAVAVMYGAGFAGAVLIEAAGEAGGAPVMAAGVLLFLAAVAALGVLFQGTKYWRWGNAPDGQLDEYELATRNRAYVTAYALLAAVTMLSWFYLDIARDAGLWQPDFSGSAAEILKWSYVLFALTLPSAVLAWIEQPARD